MKTHFLFFLIASVAVPLLVHCQVAHNEMKVLNTYDAPYAVSVGNANTILTSWKLINPDTYARFDYQLTKRNYNSTIIYYRYDLTSLKSLIAKKKQQIDGDAFVDFLLNLLNNCEGATFAEKAACIAVKVRGSKQEASFNQAIAQWQKYNDLLPATTEADKRQCLLSAIQLTEYAITSGRPSRALEIDSYVSNTLADKMFSIPVSQQIGTIKILSSQAEIGSYSSDYIFKNTDVHELRAPYKTRLPFSVSVNQFIGRSSGIWPGTYVLLGYSQSQLMYSSDYDSLFQSHKGVSYNHASLGIGYLPDISKGSKALLTLDLELSYRLNFRREYQLDTTGFISNNIKKTSSESGGLESGNVCVGLGLGLGIKNFMLKAKIRYAAGGNQFDKQYKYPIDKCAFTSITLAVPLATKTTFRYRW